MRHYPELRASQPRWQRLFEYRRQQDVQRLLHEAGEVPDALPADVAARLLEAANRSFRTDEPYNSTVR